MMCFRFTGNFLMILSSAVIKCSFSFIAREIHSFFPLNRCSLKSRMIFVLLKSFGAFFRTLLFKRTALAISRSFSFWIVFIIACLKISLQLMCFNDSMDFFRSASIRTLTMLMHYNIVLQDSVWRARRGLNPQPAIYWTAAQPLELRTRDLMVQGAGIEPAGMPAYHTGAVPLGYPCLVEKKKKT